MLVIRFLLVLTLGLCSIGTASADGVIRRGVGHESESIDPHRVNSALAFNFVLDLFEGLTAFTVDGKVEPALAKSWSASPDGKTWTFKLRRDLKWSNGTPVTADDVVFTFRRFVDPKTAAPFATTMHMIVNGAAVNRGAMPLDKLGVTSPDPDTIVISLEHPAPYLPLMLARASFVVLPRATITKFGDDWIKPENFVGNGAYVLKDRIPNSHMTYVRNPQYRAPAILDTVVYEATTDIEAAVKQFRAGQLDLQYNIPASQVANLKREIPNELKLVEAEPVSVYLIVNMRSPKLADVRVRRALALAVDRTVMVTNILQNGGVATETLVPKGFADYNPPEAPALSMQQRTAQAKALLTEAGVSPASPLKLTFRFNGENNDTKRIGIAAAAMWKPLGVTLDLVGSESKVMFADLAQGNFDISYIGVRPEYPDAASYLTVLLSTDRLNYGKYNSPAYDDLITRALDVPEQAARHQLFRDAEGLMLKDQAIIPIYYLGTARYMVSTRVRGWVPNTDRMHLSRYLSLAP